MTTELPQVTMNHRVTARLPVLEWAAVLLGISTFAWGFLDWYGVSGDGQNGYRLMDGYPPIGFALVATVLAVVNMRPDRTERTAWFAIGMSLLAVAFTVLAAVVKPTFIALVEALATIDGDSNVHLTIKIGLILTLVSTALQLICLVVAWLFASGRVVTARRSAVVPAPAAGQQLFGASLFAADGEWQADDTPGNYRPE